MSAVAYLGALNARCIVFGHRPGAFRFGTVHFEAFGNDKCQFVSQSCSWEDCPFVSGLQLSIECALRCGIWRLASYTEHWNASGDSHPWSCKPYLHLTCVTIEQQRKCVTHLHADDIV